jgi:hypothetical protein
MIRDPSGRGRIARVAVLIWLAADGALAISSLMAIAALGGLGSSIRVDPPLADSVSGVTGIAYTVAMVASVVCVGRWIMRVNGNAHMLSERMTMSPGWNVGWFFVPLANLWKPFDGIRQTWQASSNPADPHSVPVPAFLRWWWGLWIVTNVLGNISARLTFDSSSVDNVIASSWLDVASFVLDVPLTITLLMLIRRLNALQLQGQHFYAETFA